MYAILRQICKSWLFWVRRVRLARRLWTLRRATATALQVTALVAHSSSEKLFEQVAPVPPARLRRCPLSRTEIPEDIPKAVSGCSVKTCCWRRRTRVRGGRCACDSGGGCGRAAAGGGGNACLRERTSLLANKEPLVRGRTRLSCAERVKSGARAACRWTASTCCHLPVLAGTRRAYNAVRRLIADGERAARSSARRRSR